MGHTFFDEVVRFRAARMWQTNLESEDGSDEHDLGLSAVLEKYVNDLRFRLGFEEPYTGDLDRLQALKTIVRGFGPVYDYLAKQGEAFPVLPPAAQQLLDWLNGTNMELAYKIHALEELYPEHAEAFRLDREQYAQTLLN